MESIAIKPSKKIFVIPGNPGIGKENKVNLVEISSSTIQDYIKIAQDNEIDLTIVGPEAPLVDGIADEFQKNLKIFGPNKFAAQLEGSKIFVRKS